MAIRLSPKSASSRSTSPPKGWAFCDGQILPLSQNTALFSLLGTTYGGDGKSNFALPELQGNAPMHPGQGPVSRLHDLGETGGSETVTLARIRDPFHSHALARRRVTAGDDQTPAQGADLAASVGPVYAARAALAQPCRTTLSPGRRRPAAQQPAAVPHAQLLHRPPGRLPAAHVRGSRPPDEDFPSVGPAGGRAIPLRRVREHPHRGARARGLERRAEVCVRAPTVRGADPALPRGHYPTATLDLILVDSEPAGRLYVDRWPGEIRVIPTSSSYPRTSARALGRGCCERCRQRPPLRADR